MAAPVSRCDCGAVLTVEELVEGLCSACQEQEQDLLDDPEQTACPWCGKPADEDDLNEEGECPSCVESAAYQRELESDYRFWTR